MNNFLNVTSALTILIVAGCGGGGGNDTPVGPSGGRLGSGGGNNNGGVTSSGGVGLTTSSGGTTSAGLGGSSPITSGGNAGANTGAGGMFGGAGRMNGGGPSFGGNGNGSAGRANGGAASGGASPMGGSTGVAGGGAASGGAASGGTGGSGPTTTCTITAQATQSTAIPTVQTVTFTTSLTGITKAEIQFGPAESGPNMVAPVDLMEPSYKTYLLGMKPSTSYVYRVAVTSSAGTCTSEDYMVKTGALMNAPKPTMTVMDAAHHDKGFILTSSGLGGSSAYIMDADGTVVWVAPSGNVPNSPSRAHLSWDAKRFITMSLNVQNSSSGKIQSIAMDGTDAKSVSGVQASHHDFTAIPGGIATLMWNKSGIDAPCSLVEFPDSGASKTIVADMSSLYSSNSFHTNAIHYYENDDSYTLGDRNPNLFVKVTRAGQLVWQFGGNSPKDAAKVFSGVTNWSVNHGHQLLSDGTFVFFNNGMGSSSAAYVYKLDTASMKATQQAKFTGVNSMVLGDVQALPNGNFLITGSTTGTIQEVTASGTVVMSIKASSGQQFGYAEFRESLYGKPPY